MGFLFFSFLHNSWNLQDSFCTFDIKHIKSLICPHFVLVLLVAWLLPYFISFYSREGESQMANGDGNPNNLSTRADQVIYSQIFHLISFHLAWEDNQIRSSSDMFFSFNDFKFVIFYRWILFLLFSLSSVMLHLSWAQLIETYVYFIIISWRNSHRTNAKRNIWHAVPWLDLSSLQKKMMNSILLLTTELSWTELLFIRWWRLQASTPSTQNYEYISPGQRNS